MSISTRETEEYVASLNSSGDEESTFVADRVTPPTSKTGSGKQYIKQYGESIVNSPQLAEETVEQSMRPSVKTQKELRYVKALPKNNAGPSTPFCFDVLVQLANIPTRITLYKLFRLFKSIRDALKEALADSFRNPNSCYMSRGRWQPLRPCLEAVSLRHLHPRRHVSERKT